MRECPIGIKSEDDSVISECKYLTVALNDEKDMIAFTIIISKDRGAMTVHFWVPIDISLTISHTENSFVESKKNQSCRTVK